MQRFLIALVLYLAAMFGAWLAGAPITWWVIGLGVAWSLFMTYITRSRK